MQTLVDILHHRVAPHRDAIISFLRDLVAIPSYDGNIRDVAARVERELRALGFADIHYAPYGDIVARIDNGKRVLFYDSHLDTVGVGAEKSRCHGAGFLAPLEMTGTLRLCNSPGE